MWSFQCQAQRPCQDSGPQVPTALLRPGAVPFVGKESFEGGEEKRPEPAALPSDAGEIVFLEQPAKELLGEILGIVGSMTLSADVGIKRIPVGLAEVGEGLPGLRAVRPRGGGDQGPAGRGEHAAIVPGGARERMRFLWPKS